MTTYRRMAQEVVDKVAAELGVSSKARTRWIRLGSRDVGALTAAVTRRCRVIGLDPRVAENLVRCYGDRALEVLSIAHEDDLREPLVEQGRSITAEVAYSVRAEMATHLSDVLARRTRLAMIDRHAGIGSGATAAATMAAEHGWSRRETRRQVDAHRAEVEAERGLPLPSESRRAGLRRSASTG